MKKWFAIIGFLAASAALYQLNAIRSLHQKQEDRVSHKERFRGHAQEADCDLDDKCREKEFQKLYETYCAYCADMTTHGVQSVNQTSEKYLESAIEKIVSETKDPALFAERNKIFADLRLNRAASFDAAYKAQQRELEESQEEARKKREAELKESKRVQMVSGHMIRYSYHAWCSDCDMGDVCREKEFTEVLSWFSASAGDRFRARLESLISEEPDPTKAAAMKAKLDEKLRELDKRKSEAER